MDFTVQLDNQTGFFAEKVCDEIMFAVIEIKPDRILSPENSAQLLFSKLLP